MKQLIYGILVFFSPLLSLSQDITGLWKGTMFNDSTRQTLQYEIIINKDNGKYSGFSHTWFLINNNKYYGVKKLKVEIARDGKIVIRDAALIDNNYPLLSNKDIRQLNILDFTKNGEEVILDGVFVTNKTKEYKELTGHINVRRVSTSSQSDLIRFLEKAGEANSFTSTR